MDREEQREYVTIELEASLYALLKRNAERKQQSIAEHLETLIWNEHFEETDHNDDWETDSP